MTFSGDIVIIDPAEIVSDPADWQMCRFGAELSALGFTDYLFIDACDGWGSKVCDTNSGMEIGSFTADSGMLCVVLLEELLDYRPDLDKKTLRHADYCTVIRDFSGEVRADAEQGAIIGSGSVDFSTMPDECAKS